MRDNKKQHVSRVQADLNNNDIRLKAWCTTTYSMTSDPDLDSMSCTTHRRQDIAHPLDLNMIPVSDNMHPPPTRVSPQRFTTLLPQTRRHTAGPSGSKTTAAGGEIKPSVTCNPTPASHRRRHGHSDTSSCRGMTRPRMRAARATYSAVSFFSHLLLEFELKSKELQQQTSVWSCKSMPS